MPRSRRGSWRRTQSNVRPQGARRDGDREPSGRVRPGRPAAAICPHPVALATADIASSIRNAGALVWALRQSMASSSCHNEVNCGRVLGRRSDGVARQRNLTDPEEWAPTASLPQIIDGATYVSCFTEKPDQLSQWRGYGGHGYSVGFTRDGLDNLVNEGASSLVASAGPVIQVGYGQPGLEKLFREVSDFFATRPIPLIPTAAPLVDIFSHIRPSFATVKARGIRRRARVARDCIQIWAWTRREPSVQRRTSSSSIPQATFDPSAVAFVYIGPGGDFHDKRALRAFLVTNGYDLDRAWIEQSSAPFRGG
jgi:hypothetical protein